MTAYFCRECLVTEVSPTARDGRCTSCRPPRRHSRSRREQLNSGMSELLTTNHRRDSYR